MAFSVSSQSLYEKIIFALKNSPTIRAYAKEHGWKITYFPKTSLSDAMVVLNSNTHIQIGRGAASLVSIKAGGRMKFWPARRNVAIILTDVLEMIKETK